MFQPYIWQQLIGRAARAHTLVEPSHDVHIRVAASERLQPLAHPFHTGHLRAVVHAHAPFT